MSLKKPESYEHFMTLLYPKYDQIQTRGEPILQWSPKYKYFQHLLKSKGYSTDISKTSLNIKEKTEFLNQRLEIHHLCLEQLHKVRTQDLYLQYYRVIDAVKQSVGEEIYTHATALNKVSDDMDNTVQEMEDHKQAFDKLRKIFRASDVLVHHMAAVKINFSIDENIKASYKDLKAQLEGMKGALEYAIENAEAGKFIREDVGADVAYLIWEKSAAFLVDQGQKFFGKQKYDDPLLNFIFHKHVEAKSKDSFEDIIELVKFIRSNVS